MPGPAIPRNSGAEFYGSKAAIESEYDRIQRQPELPGVAPPQAGASPTQAAASIAQSGFYDEDAPDILQIIQGGVFDPPFTVTLMQRSGMREFRSDAGVKREADWKLCKETVRDPSDLLRIQAGVNGEIYKPLNTMSLEFQLMLYIASKNGALRLPAPPSQKGAVAASLAADDEETDE